MLSVSMSDPETFLFSQLDFESSCVFESFSWPPSLSQHITPYDLLQVKDIKINRSNKNHFPNVVKTRSGIFESNFTSCLPEGTTFLMSYGISSESLISINFPPLTAPHTRAMIPHSFMVLSTWSQKVMVLLGCGSLQVKYVTGGELESLYPQPTFCSFCFLCVVEIYLSFLSLPCLHCHYEHLVLWNHKPK